MLNWFRRKKLNSRHFNRIEFDRARGVVIKRSEDKQKLIREIQWYLQVPGLFKRKIPQVLNYSLDAQDPWLELQHLKGQSLDQALLDTKHDLATWNQIHGTVHMFLKQCLEEGARNPISNYRKFKMMEYVYLRKTFARIKEYEESFSELCEVAPVINGRVCLSLAQAQIEILKWFNRVDFQEGFLPGLLHGDLSFGNIFYSTEKFSFHLIDPRGSFGEVGIFGDVRYDLAKMLHCSHGNYDFIVNGRFELREMKPNNYTFKILMTPEQLELSAVATRLLFETFAVSKPDLLFIESLLFLSMIPLHADQPRAQKAFLLRGLEVLGSALHLRDEKSNKEQGRDNHHPPNIAEI